MSKGSKILISILFLITIGLTVAAIIISQRLGTVEDPVGPGDSQAASCTYKDGAKCFCTEGTKCCNGMTGDTCSLCGVVCSFRDYQECAPGQQLNCRNVDSPECGPIACECTNACPPGWTRVDPVGGQCPAGSEKREGVCSDCNNPYWDCCRPPDSGPTPTPTTPPPPQTGTPTPTPPTQTGTPTPTPPTQTGTPTPTLTPMTPVPTLPYTPTPTPVITQPGVRCGDSICHPGEMCEVGNQTRCIPGGGIFTPGECRANCTFCGDGIWQPEHGEQCDDGNSFNYDSCNNNCQRVEIIYCGDGIIQPGEECEPNVPNSCGPGAVCNPLTCRCEGVLPGLCGSDCFSDVDCPIDNVCYNGRCRLAICVPGQMIPLSQPISGTGGYVSGSWICTPDGCDIVECGSQCGAGGQCPPGLACSRDNRCVIPYCINNYCDNECILPPTALFDNNIWLYVLAVILILSGLVIYKTELGSKLFNLMGDFGDTRFGSILFTFSGVNLLKINLQSIQRFFNPRNYRKETREKFEKKMSKKKK